MGDRTIELIVTDGYDDAEESRAGRVFVFGKVFAHFLHDGDTELEAFLFKAHDDDGNEYVVSINNAPAEKVWSALWRDGWCRVMVDRSQAMRAITTMPDMRA
jgi:hypothetical protein